MKRTTSGAFDRPRPLSGQPFLTCLTVVCEIAANYPKNLDVGFRLKPL